jgi:hypothetical protein
MNLKRAFIEGINIILLFFTALFASTAPNVWFLLGILAVLLIPASFLVASYWRRGRIARSFSVLSASYNGVAALILGGVWLYVNVAYLRPGVSGRNGGAAIAFGMMLFFLAVALLAALNAVWLVRHRRPPRSVTPCPSP